jgi:hypothetical protein
MSYTAIGILALFGVFFLFNLISIALIFIGLSKAFSFFFAGAICLFAFLYFFSKFKFEINGKEYSLPIFPGPSFLKFALFAVIVTALVVQVFKLDNKVYVVERSWAYYFQGEKIKKELKNEEVLLLEKNINVGKRGDRGEQFSLVMLKNKDGIFYQGVEVLVPTSALSKKIGKPNFFKKNFSYSLERGFKKLTDKPQPGLVVLTPGDILRQDVHKTSSKRTMIVFEKFRKGDLVELVEDFSWEVSGENPTTWVRIGGEKAGDNFEIKGSRPILKRGTRFVFKNKYINLGLNSSGEQGGFSELKIKRIKNIL